MNNYYYIIENLLKRKENEQLEFKSDINIDVICQIATAMLNTRGGDIVVGVDDNRKTVGLSQKRLLSNLQKSLNDEIKPHAPINFQPVEYKEKTLLLINVWEGYAKPYTYKGKIYQRTVAGNRQVDKLGYAEINRMINSRTYYDNRWEVMPIFEASFKDLDDEEVIKTMRAFNARRDENVYDDIEDFLIKEGFFTNGNITLGAIILFGTNPVKYAPQAAMRLTRYLGPNITDRFEDQIYRGNILKSIPRILGDLNSFFGEIEIVNGLKREKRWNYPQMALREGVVNACAHRDYSNPGSFLRISCYSDKTEVASYGSLPSGLTVQDLSVPHQSILRNPNIAKTLFYRGYMEMLGSGTQRMLQDCKVNGFANPIWKEENGAIVVSFNGVGSSLRDNVNKGETYDDFFQLVDGATEGKAEGISEGTKGKLAMVMSAIHNMPRATAPAISTRLDIPKKSIERYLKTLKDLELIKFEGPKRSGRFVINNESNKELKIQHT